MIYAVCNQKGGVGKSTTCGAIVAGATLRGKKALAVDMDPQGDVTYSMAGDIQAAGAYELITGEKTAAEVIQHTAQGDIIAGNAAIVTMDTILTGDRRISALRDALRPVRGQYDVIAVDCPPTLGTPMINALVAADKVIIPTQADAYNLQSLAMLVQTIKTTQKNYNNRLHIAGILFTRYNLRTVIARTYTDIIKDQAKKWHIPVFSSTIREGVAIKESQTCRESLFTYAPRNNVTKDYAAFLDELGI